MFLRFAHQPARRAALLTASAMLAALSTSAPAQATTTPWLAEFWNEWDVPQLDPLTHSFGPTAIEIDFAGNIVGCIPTQVLDGWTDAYQAWNDVDPVNKHADSIHIAFNQGGYTSVTFSGTALQVPPPVDEYLNHGGSFPGPTWGNGTLSYHFGINPGYAPLTCSGNPVIWKRWIYKRKGLPTQYLTIPFGDSHWPGVFDAKNIKLAKAAVLYIEITAPGADVPGKTGTWFWNNYVPALDGTPPTFVYTNNGKDAITLGVVGIETGLDEPTDKKCLRSPRCKENQTNLDQLNEIKYLPPNNAGSPMTLLPQYNGVVVQPGEKIEIGLH